MYFPYFRGRQFELIAIRELVEKDLIGNKIIPVIEPVKPTSTLVKTLNLYTKKNHMHALVLNPDVGSFATKLKEKKTENACVVDDISKTLHSKYLIKAYLMNAQTGKLLSKEPDLNKLMIINQNHDCTDKFSEIYKDFEPLYTLIPEDRTFSRKVSKSKVLFVDRFSKAQRNSDYGKNKDEFFSNDHLFFQEEGFQGFSDYSIVGADYNESGFAPFAVAIHIVYFDKDKALRIHHFVSTSNSDINDPAGKFGEAIAELVIWLKKHPIQPTFGLKQFLECANTGKYPGLGTLKKYSIMHHLELINIYLEGQI
jgi:hypothetical protein